LTDPFSPCNLHTTAQYASHNTQYEITGGSNGFR